MNSSRDQIKINKFINYFDDLADSEKREEKRPNVNYAKDWLDQLFLIPVPKKGFTSGCDHYGALNKNFPVYCGHSQIRQGAKINVAFFILKYDCSLICTPG